MKRRSEIAALVFGLIALAPAAAQGFCRTANCDSKDIAWQVCTPAEPDDCGTPLFWGNRCVGYTLQQDASSQVSLEEAETVFSGAFNAWVGADCGNGMHPSIQVDYMGTVECDAQEYNKKKANANVIMFRDDAWPYAGTSNVLALTTVTYNLESSEIYDADMEINSHDHDLTIGNDAVKFDLLSIATHEAGHFLGLAHSHSSDATMFADYKQSSTDLRDLLEDDVKGICAVYPPAMPRSIECDNEPRHGFSDLCAAEQPEVVDDSSGAGCAVCAVSPAPPGGPPAPAAFALLGLSAAALLRRKSRAGKPDR
jgi:MYXO-CTERM domain-containing protein